MKRKTKAPKGTDESWLLTYADSITLLMAFFVLLLSISSIDQSKVEKMTSGISDVFSKTESEQPFSSMEKKLNDMVKDPQLKDNISITPDPLGLHLRFSSHLLFESGTAVIKERMLPIMKLIANAILESEYTDFVVKVEGHTDNIPIRTSQYESNWELSAHRATNVVKHLIKSGIPKSKVWAIALSDSVPLVPNLTRDGKSNPVNQAKNRRIEVYIHRNFK
ncbi:hypothetical protein DID78_02220 [Candidatus Marinamargulisbacteria bacterium SCGC AG-343-D04]|nr:hypothetical protein DID78_02220 [Candidatus Marinamargulisbacteria bacterium SCGC AG-343-D04]